MKVVYRLNHSAITVLNCGLNGTTIYVSAFHSPRFHLLSFWVDMAKLASRVKVVYFDIKR